VTTARLVSRCAAVGVAVLALALPSQAAAQRADLQYGRWWPAEGAVDLYALN
jgi:hypothetical protein